MSSTVQRSEWLEAEEGRWALALVLQWAVGLGVVSQDEAEDHWVALASRDVRSRYAALRALGPLRTMARQVARDDSMLVDTVAPSYWTRAEVLELPGGRWEARVGWGGTIHQVGEWRSRELALAALASLRPTADITVATPPSRPPQ